MIPVGVLLTPIIKKQVLSLNDLKGKSFTVDAFNIMYQFLALIRTREGTPLTDKEGRTTSHLVELAFRTTRLISDYNMKLVFVFDGRPPLLKQAENRKRRKAKQKAQKEYLEAVAERDYATAFSKATRMSSLTRDDIQDAKQLLDLLGVSWVQAPSEGEAQAAYMASKGDVWASNSRDYDSLLFGTPRLVRYLTIGGQEWLPSKNKARKLEPELVILNDFLEHLEVTRPQLIDMAILIGTDFNEGNEGLMAKKLDSPYSPGKRGKAWFKIKQVETLDVVVVAADWGSGRRMGWLSNYHLGVWSGEEYLVIGKTFKGLTDEEFNWMTAKLQELKESGTNYTVKVRPELVVEVAFNEIQKSPHYKSGYALRFARITRIREDKGVEDADTLDRVGELYDTQFRYKASLNSFQKS